MNTPAIHLAMRLEKQTEELAWLCFPDSDLPEGINDLLRLAASPEQLKEFAITNEFDSEELSIALHGFIEKVLLNEKNSNEKIIGTNKFATSQTQKFHYKLLMKIYHPDLNDRPGADYYSALISKAYQDLKTKNNENEAISFSENRKPPHSYYEATKKSETQISNSKTIIAILSAISICTLVVMSGKFYGTSDIELVANNTNTINNDTINVVQEVNTDTQQLMKVTSVKQDVAVETIAPSIKATNTALQSLLKDLEIAYEDGNVDIIKPILANAPDLQGQTEKQLNDKLETIFEITSERKMVLFDFNWTAIRGSIEGKGKFISRYQLIGEKKWLTREGTATVTAEKNNNKLKITQLILENHDIK